VSEDSKVHSEISSFCSQTFVILDKWLNQIGKEYKGNHHASKIAKEIFQNNINANVTYYESFAKSAEQSQEADLATKSLSQN
jgi:hypothetical protein